VLAALAVVVGLKDPQLEAGVQLQVTPLFAESFVTVAAMAAVFEGAIAVGGAVLNATLIVVVVAAFTVMALVLAVILVLSTSVAVITTVLEGTVAGAV
jgi:hypothetical protein